MSDAKPLRSGPIQLLVKLSGKLVKLGKALKVGKLGLAGASAVSYSYMFTWKFSAMLMVMLFVHESGHVWAMKRCGMKTKGIYFLPFIGGAAVAEGEFPSRQAEVFVALMGPVAGLLLAGFVALFYPITHSPFVAAAAGWMAMINLLQLLPVSPLDGGRVFKSIAFSTSSRAGFTYLVGGLLMSAGLAMMAGSGLFLFLLIVGSIDLAIEYRRRAKRMAMPGFDMATAALSYGVLASLLWGLMALLSGVPGAAAALAAVRG